MAEELCCAGPVQLSAGVKLNPKWRPAGELYVVGAVDELLRQAKGEKESGDGGEGSVEEAQMRRLKDTSRNASEVRHLLCILSLLPPPRPGCASSIVLPRLTSSPVMSQRSRDLAAHVSWPL